ncbi:amidase family protein [Aquisalimonas asiatica]|uniref:Amidase n=1 Tax=Aquisalimonas asiatica TaxID=406100 RepID=A0A1H8SX25_9GAMM|nr:amidase family protein [Aquisalimonas asiatica]SEO83310.1 Amidase [Aquisalimonas asiatica]
MTASNPDTHSLPRLYAALRDAGVSLLEGSARLALGTDTAGSVRVPAAMTGVAGMPVGLQLLAGPWREAHLLRLGASLEGVLGRGADLPGYPR